MLGGRVEGVIEGAMSKIECKAIRHRRSSRNRDVRFGGADVRLRAGKNQRLATMFQKTKRVSVRKAKCLHA
jgi:hypothetical protein